MNSILWTVLRVGVTVALAGGLVTIAGLCGGRLRVASVGVALFGGGAVVLAVSMVAALWAMP